MLIFIHAHLRNTTLGANNSNWISTLPSHLTLQNKNKKKIVSLIYHYKVSYSPLSANGHSCKPTALLRHVLPLYLHVPSSGLSLVCRRGHFLKVKIRFFFCLCTLIGGHPVLDIWLLAIKFVFNLQIDKNTTLTEQQNSWDQFCEIFICLQESKLSVHLACN